MKRILCLLLSLALCCALAAPCALAAGSGEYTDVPDGSWAAEIIADACSYGLMEGVGDGRFGYGETISRAQFVTVLVRMFAWDAVTEGADAFSDISGSWARANINTAAAHDVVDAGGAFRPNDPITRREMSVMLVRALGYGDIAEQAADYALPFTDVDADRGYIAVAYDIGMTTGMTETTFAPEATAVREQAAAMLVRIYEKYIAGTAFTHAFYALSSYSQIDLAKQFDAVSFGWSRMCLDEETGPWLNTGSEGGNEYRIPSGYTSAVTELESAGVKLHLDVYMDDTSALSALLGSAAWRTQAVDAILAELERTYPELGRNPYSGVTIDFEGLRAAQKADFTAFLTELDAALEAKGLTLYVAVMPATADGVYYDGYDYRAIGEAADKVILMAHDYSARSMAGFEGSTYHETAALTPLAAVYYALRVAADPDTGVADRSKLTLAISCTGTAWETDENGLLTSPDPIYPTTDTIYTRLKDALELGWSETYRNPWARYVTESGQHIFLWYEDARSVSAKLELARMFGVTGVSVWRLGLIPDYDDQGLYYNVMDALG